MEGPAAPFDRLLLEPLEAPFGDSIWWPIVLCDGAVITLEGMMEELEDRVVEGSGRESMTDVAGLDLLLMWCGVRSMSGDGGGEGDRALLVPLCMVSAANYDH